MTNTVLDEKKEHFVRTAHQIYQKGLTPGKSGNISMKTVEKASNKEVILITPSGVSLKDLNLKNVVVTDLNGTKLEGEGVPSSELHMHLEIYRQRNDIKAVVHTHSPYATGFSFSDAKIPCLEGFGVIKDPYIKEVDYATPGSGELVKLTSNGLKNDDVLILKSHGVLTIGPDLNEAVLLAEFTESCAKTGFISHTLK